MNIPLKRRAKKTSLTSAKAAAVESSKSFAKYVEKLFQIQSGARKAENLSELQYLIANESLKLLQGSQILVFRGRPHKSGWRLEKISSVAQVDYHAPLTQWLTHTIREQLPVKESSEPVILDLSKSTEAVEYPFPKGVYIPIVNRAKESLGGFCVLSNSELDLHTRNLAIRLQDTFSHAWNALAPKRDFTSRILSRRNLAFALIALAAVLCIPVPMTVLAPAEIVAKDPTIVAAPIAGVIEEVFPDPNVTIRAGEELLRFNATQFEGEFAISEREMEVARARYQRSTQSAFSTRDGRRELAITKAEFEVAKVEFNYAAEKLKQTIVTAPVPGVLIYSSKDDWEGRPVSIGERVMRIADPNKVAIKIDLPVADAALLEQELFVRLFLDARPLSPLDASITRRSFSPELSGQDIMAFPLRAELNEQGQDMRIGWRGTAQLSGDTVPLAYNLFRKPIAVIRQYIGY